MKTLILYMSIHHGNTKKVATAIANILDGTLTEPAQANTSIVEQYDLIGFGSGIYFGRHHRKLLDFVDKLPVMKGKKAFIFSTSGLRQIQLLYDFHRPLRRRLQCKGFNLVGEFSCRGFDTYGALRLLGGINRGRPNADDLRSAEDFAKRIKNRGF